MNNDRLLVNENMTRLFKQSTLDTHAAGATTAQ